MEKVRIKIKDIVDKIYNFYSIICRPLLIVELCYLILIFTGHLTEVKAKVNGIELESMQYRGATLYWEAGNPMPKEKLEVFFTVMDSLSDDVVPKYSLSQNHASFFYLTVDEYYFGELTKGSSSDAIAYANLNEVFLSPVIVDSNRFDGQKNLSLFQYGPWVSFDNSQIYNDGDFAMVLIHEYVHTVQMFRHISFLRDYAEDVGWQGKTKPEEDDDFYKVLSDYSLTDPLEDMSETFQYSYLCGNNLEALSEVRLQYIDEFWDVAREEYCRDFH